jgi:hypothetical protein
VAARDDGSLRRAEERHTTALPRSLLNHDLAGTAVVSNGDVGECSTSVELDPTATSDPTQPRSAGSTSRASASIRESAAAWRAIWAC